MVYRESTHGGIMKNNLPMVEQQLLIPDNKVDAFMVHCLTIINQERLDSMLGNTDNWLHGTIDEVGYYVIQWNWLTDADGARIYNECDIEGILKDSDPRRSAWMSEKGFIPDPPIEN